MKNQENWIKIIHLLSDVVVYDAYNFEQFLKKLIKLILNIVPVDSCLIYFFDREEKKLILIASKKPHARLIGNVTLEKNEGITGWVATHEKTVVLTKEAYKDKRFKAFDELPEDTFEAFLSIPILDKEGVVGVINLQHKERYEFSKDQIKAVEAIVRIISSAFQDTVLNRTIGKLETKIEERKLIEKAKGILMKEKQMNESEAFRLLRNESMKKRKSMKDISEAVLLVYG